MLAWEEGQEGKRKGENEKERREKVAKAKAEKAKVAKAKVAKSRAIAWLHGRVEVAKAAWKD